ncbi:MAG TPA: FAD-binding oxidoreductase [Spirochaetota bacterium]|nr:FAD-binding oxidoreductase [Spirochaetota bacterium]
MSAQYHIKTFDTITTLRRFIWLIVPVVSIAGFFQPKLGLFIFPLFAAIMVMGFFTGRYWCGNFCPRGALFDFPVRAIGAFDRIPRLFTSAWFRALVLALLMGFFIRNTVNAFSAWGTVSFWDRLGMVGVMMCAATTGIGLVLSLVVNPRTWCSFCPMGTVQKLLHAARTALIGPVFANPRITMTQPSACQKCGKCARVCPMQLAPYRELNDVDQVAALDCIKCGSCVAHCAGNVLALESERKTDTYRLPEPLPGYADRAAADAVIESVEEIGTDIREFTFRLRDGKTLTPKPGQFVAVRVDDENEVFRSYSVSRPTDDPSRVKIAVKLDPNGWGTPRLFAMREGDTVRLEGPMGDFTVRDTDTDKLFIAGGIGITPFLSLAREAARKHPGRTVRLLYGANAGRDVIYAQYLEELRREHPNFDYAIALARPDDGWQGHRGMVTDLIDAVTTENAEAYLCGARPMIGAATRSLAGRGMPAEAIHVDTAFS